MRKLFSKLSARRISMYSHVIKSALDRTDLVHHLHLLELNLEREADLLFVRKKLVRSIIDDLESL